jgi:hypothetical protein
LAETDFTSALAAEAEATIAKAAQTIDFLMFVLPVPGGM